MSATRIPIFIIDSIDVGSKTHAANFIITTNFHINGNTLANTIQLSARFEIESLPGGTQADLADFVRELLFERFRAAEEAARPVSG